MFWICRVLLRGEQNLKLIAACPLQYVFGTKLDGRYQVDEYKIFPCLESDVMSVQKPWRTLILTFPFNGNEESGKSPYNFQRNRSVAAMKAKRFVAWFVVVTNVPTRLFYSGFGGETLLHCYHYPASSFREERLPCNPDLSARLGEYEMVSRPDFSESIIREGTTIKLPADLSLLTRKIFSLSKTEKIGFLMHVFLTNTVEKLAGHIHQYLWWL
jgi:hypothetical protein